MVAEVAVCDCEIEALPATTFPPVGSAFTAGWDGACANVFCEKSVAQIIAPAEKMDATTLADIASAKQFFRVFFKERSDLSLRLLIKLITGLFPEPGFSQSPYLYEISSRVNSLKPLIYRGQKIPLHQYGA
jgi:hypothetical protein